MNQYVATAPRFWTDPSVQVEGIFSLARQAFDTLNRAGDDEGLALAFALRASAHNALGQLRAAAADALLGLPHAHRAGRAGAELRLLAWIVAPGGYGDQSLADSHRLIEDIKGEYGNDLAMEQTFANLLTWKLAQDGHLGEAVEMMRERSQLALDRGSLIEAANWLNGVAWCQLWGSDLEGAADTTATADALCESIGETGYRSWLLAHLALILAQLERDAEAQTALNQSRALTGDNDRVNQMVHAATEGLLLAHEGDSERSERQFTEGLRIASNTEFLPIMGELWLARSLARRSLGDTTGARMAAREALTCFTRKGFVPLIQTAQARLAELTG